MSRMHGSLHDAWRAFVQDHACVASPPTRASRADHDDLHHEVGAALGWLSSQTEHPSRGDVTARPSDSFHRVGSDA